MQEPRRLERNRDRLAECHAVFAEALRGVIEDMEQQGFRPRIQDAWRSPEEQLEAFNSGHSELRFGFHNVTGPGGEKEALAVDLLDDDAPLDPSRRYILMLAAAARAHGLQTGILWGLQPATRKRINQAIATRDFDVQVKFGWDPCHVEVTGMTATQAKQGARPTLQTLRAASSGERLSDVPAPRSPRTLLVRSVSGPARARVGEVAPYRATAFNLPDPTLEETAGINWVVRRQDQTIAEFPGAGPQLDYEIPASSGGDTIRVMPFRNAPSPRVSVVTKIDDTSDVATDIATSTAVSRAARLVRVEQQGTRYFARIDGGDRFYVGSDVRYRGNRGLMNTSDESGVRYDPRQYRERFGFWADFIYPMALCESNGYFQRINTYDRARFTFGLVQFAAHTPNDNFVLLLRELLKLPLAAAYFPDLTLHEGSVYRVTDQGLQPLECSDSTEALMLYLNPSQQSVDEVEIVNAAKFIHWSQHDPAHRELQVRLTVSQIETKMRQYDRRYHLHGIVDTICLVIADIRHQGRARSSHIIDALSSHAPLDNLLQIGQDGFPERIRTLRSAIEAGVEDGILGEHQYDADKHEFVAI